MVKVYYDPEHKACAVEFDKDDTIFINSEDDGAISITSCKGGKPEMIEKQLLFSLDETDDIDKIDNWFNKWYRLVGVKVSIADMTATFKERSKLEACSPSKPSI